MDDEWCDSQRVKRDKLGDLLTPEVTAIPFLWPLGLRATSTHETESPRPLHFKHSHWWRRWSRSKFASHYAWGTNGVCECKMDVKSTWIPTWHRMDHVSWLHITLEGSWSHYMILKVPWDSLWTLSFGLSQVHGHGFRLVCEVALNFFVR